jgi:hypothetical protein
MIAPSHTMAPALQPMANEARLLDEGTGRDSWIPDSMPMQLNTPKL